ncbi:hypothetical protein Acr_15g0015360 [Actinidia rufa]|uniref:Uncharacterized protein n=1 Tax=Actinidia rufa TaxID=165716 RepID=A0A7J0FYA7_9ERIC|nr:hypothetical protein Acr_15g0015360 [Actinidia rufa]
MSVARKYTDQCRLYKFCWSRMAWGTEKSLGNQALFIGRSSFSVLASGATRNEANKVYYRGKYGKVKSYSLEDGKSIDCEDSGYSGWLASVKRWPEAMWIEPPTKHFQNLTDEGGSKLRWFMHFI